MHTARNSVHLAATTWEADIMSKEFPEYKHPLVRLRERVQENAKKSWLHEQVNGDWVSYSCEEVYEQALRIASALYAQGIEPGDRVALIAKNSPQWMISDFAMMLAGVISVPIYTTAGEPTLRYVVEHSGAKAVFMGKLENTAAAEAAFSDLPIIAFPDFNAAPELARYHWADCLEHPPLREPAEPGKHDLATLVYTSGSTGNPKGVALSFDNLAAGAQGLIDSWPAENKSRRILSYLPMAHITERSVVAMVSLYEPIDLYFSGGLDTFLDDLQHAKPTNFVSVPRLWAKFQAQVLAVIPDSDLQAMLQSTDGDGVAAGIREKLGLGHAEQFGCGSAPISKGLLEWYRRIGIDISEGWGMTETSGAVCGNMPFNADDLGTIGRPFSSVDIRLSDEGEILVRGPAIFSEYYKNPEASAEAFIDGWFRTGDRGEMTDSGALKIIGRVKEQFKTAKGKYVAPVPIESRLLALPHIEQAMVMGIGRAQPLAIIVLTESAANESRDTLTEQLQQDLDTLNSELEPHCRLNCLVVSEQAMTIENDMLTPTLKLRRNTIEKHFADYLDDRHSGVVWAS